MLESARHFWRGNHPSQRLANTACDSGVVNSQYTHIVLQRVSVRTFEEVQHEGKVQLAKGKRGNLAWMVKDQAVVAAHNRKGFVIDCATGFQ